jgi:hypothetical protein
MYQIRVHPPSRFGDLSLRVAVERNFTAFEKVFKALVPDRYVYLLNSKQYEQSNLQFEMDNMNEGKRQNTRMIAWMRE